MSHQSEDFVTITVDLADASSFPTNRDVGRLYEVAINGVGYMLADSEEGAEYDRLTTGLDPQRLATGETPFSQAVERYVMASHLDFTGGAGQQWLDRPGSTDKEFWKSRHVDPFTEVGKAKLLKATASGRTSTYTNQLLTVVDRTAYMLVGNAELAYGTVLGTPLTLGLALTDGLEGGSGALTVSALTSDGQRWYAATGRSIIRNTTATDPAASWSAQTAVDIAWSAGRICAAVKAGGSTTPNRFTTLNDSGAEERASGHLTLPAGHTLVMGGSTSGFYYFGGYAGSKGDVYAWQLGIDQSGNLHTPFSALELPGGLVPATVGVGGGSVWVKAYRPEGASAGQALLFRCVPDQSGALTPFFVTELAEVGGSIDHSKGGFAVSGDQLLFSWTNLYGTATGLGAVDLASGGWANWLCATGVTGVVRAVDVWQGRPVFTVNGTGMFVEQDATYMTEGTIDLSISDGGSLLDKVFDEVLLTVDVLDAGESVEVWYSTDGGGSYTELNQLGPQAGLTEGAFSLSKKGPSFGVRLILNGDGTSATSVTGVTTRYHQLGLADTILVLPIECSDDMSGVNGDRLPTNGPGTGARIARDLLALAQSRVKVQDIDWAVTKVAETFEVIQVRKRIVAGTYDRTLGYKRWHTIVLVTLRKDGAS